MSIRELADGHFRVRFEAARAFSSRVEAERFTRLVDSAIADARRRFDRGDWPCCSIRERLDDFLDQQRIWRGNARATLAAHRRRLLAFAAAFEDRPLDRVAREEVRAWIDARLRRRGNRRRYQRNGGISRDTINNDLKSLRRFCDWAIECGHAPPGLELLSVPPLRIDGKIDGNRFPPRALVREHFLRILRRIERAAPHVALVLRAMLLLGARPECLFRLRWQDLQFPAGGVGAVGLPALKGGAEGSVPIMPSSQLHRVFSEARRLFLRFHGRRPRGQDPIFITRRGRSLRRPLGWTTDAYDHELARLCDKLGIDGFSAYLARHSAITWLQQQPGIGDAARQAYARHLQVTTQNCYSHRSGGDGGPAYSAMERIVGGRPIAPANNPDSSDMADLSDALQTIDGIIGYEK